MFALVKVSEGMRPLKEAVELLAGGLTTCRGFKIPAEDVFPNSMSLGGNHILRFPRFVQHCT